MIKATEARKRTQENEARYEERFKIATKSYVDKMLEKANSAVEMAIANKFYETAIDIESYVWNPQYRDILLSYRECCELIVKILEHDYDYCCTIYSSNKRIMIKW